MEGIRRSKLVFAGGYEGPEAVSIKDLKRVREPVSRSKSGAQVKVADALHGPWGVNALALRHLRTLGDQL
jgi:hypothetical protein